MFDVQEFRDLVGANGEGVLIASGGTYPLVDPDDPANANVYMPEITKDFVRRYLERYDKLPDGFAAAPYSTAWCIMELCEKVGPDSHVLAEQISQLTDFPLVSGMNVTIDEDKNALRPCVLYELQADGTYKTLVGLPEGE